MQHRLPEPRQPPCQAGSQHKQGSRASNIWKTRQHHSRRSHSIAASGKTMQQEQAANACSPGPGSVVESLLSWLPMAVLTDSYKATHYLQYPRSSKMQAYAEFRTGFDKDQQDTRLIFLGLRYILETFISRRWNEADVSKAALFFRSHLAPDFAAFPFPEQLFLKFVRENNGYFPVKLEALQEATCVHAHVPVYQITTEGEYAPLCTFLETLLTMVWYPTTVATKSRRARDIIEAAFARSADGGAGSPLLGSRLHDFGFRGCSCVEQSVLGGTAHLLNFDGTDTLSAAYYAQQVHLPTCDGSSRPAASYYVQVWDDHIQVFHLNAGQPVGMSIPATEHSVMTSWLTERAAIENMIEQFGSGMYACVMDSFDYAEALSSVLPSVAQKKIGKGGFLILRPDSGNPVEVVLMALRAAERVFGADCNSTGFKVPRGCSVIQGDGIGLEAIADILDAVVEAGFSADTVAFGMGGGLLQRVNRDTLSFATKLCHIEPVNGEPRDVMKLPKSDLSKYSLPGAMAVKRVDGIPTVFPAEGGHVAPGDNMLHVVWDKGPVQVQWETFDEMRERVNRQWHALPKTADVLSAPLKQKIKEVTAKLGRTDIF